MDLANASMLDEAHRRGRGHDDGPPPLEEHAATPSSSTPTPIPRRSPCCGPGPSRSASSCVVGRRRRGRRELLRRPALLPRLVRRRPRPRAADRRGPRRAAGSRSSPATCSPWCCSSAPGRAGRRHRRRVGPALRRAHGLRRAARRVPGHPRRLRPVAARAAWSGSAPTPPAAPRCASPCRPVSSTSAGRRRPATSAPRRCCWPTSPACTPCGTAPTGSRRIAERVHRLTSILAAALRDGGHRGRQRHVVRHPARCGCRAGRPRSSPRRAARRINLRPVDADTVGLSLDETTTPAVRAGRRRPAFGLPELDVDELDRRRRGRAPRRGSTRR